MARVHGKPNCLTVVLFALLACVLAVFLFPTLAGEGGPHMTSRCLSRIKQLAFASSIYVADYDGRLMHRDAWMDQLEPYLKNSEIFHCPALEETAKDKRAVYGYSMHGKLSGVDSDEVPNPEKVVLFFESSSLWRNASDNLQSLPEPPRQHGETRGNIVGFLDTHVKLFRTNAEIPGAPN